MDRNKLYDLNQLRMRIDTLNDQVVKIARMSEAEYVSLNVARVGEITIGGDIKTKVMEMVLETYKEMLADKEREFLEA